jgi:hypothetical protein
VKLIRLVAEKGGFFRSHKDTPKGEDHIGTLVLCLPTTFSGGQFVLKHKEKETTLDWASGCAGGGGVQWVFLFSDVDHHIEPVTAGVRLTVAYDVFVVDPFRFTASSLDPHSFHFGEQLSKALGHSEFLPFGGTVGFALSHAYPVCADGFDFKREYPKLLKGADALLYHVALSLGLEVQLRAVYQTDSCNLKKSLLDTGTVTFVDDFGPYALNTWIDRSLYRRYSARDNPAEDDLPQRHQSFHSSVEADPMEHARSEIGSFGQTANRPVEGAEWGPRDDFVAGPLQRGQTLYRPFEADPMALAHSEILPIEDTANRLIEADPMEGWAEWPDAQHPATISPSVEADPTEHAPGPIEETVCFPIPGADSTWDVQVPSEVYPVDNTMHHSTDSEDDLPDNESFAIKSFALKTVDDLVNEIEGQKYDSDDDASAAVLLTSTEASEKELYRSSGCGEEYGQDKEIRAILRKARAKVEQNVVWARRPEGRTWSQAGNFIAMGNEVRTVTIPVFGRGRGLLGSLFHLSPFPSFVLHSPG